MPVTRVDHASHNEARGSVFLLLSEALLLSTGGAQLAIVDDKTQNEDGTYSAYLVIEPTDDVDDMALANQDARDVLTSVSALARHGTWTWDGMDLITSFQVTGDELRVDMPAATEEQIQNILYKTCAYLVGLTPGGRNVELKTEVDSVGFRIWTDADASVCYEALQTMRERANKAAEVSVASMN